MKPTNLQLATHYKLNKDTVQKWKKTRPEVYEALMLAYDAMKIIELEDLLMVDDNIDIEYTDNGFWESCHFNAFVEEKKLQELKKIVIDAETVKFKKDKWFIGGLSLLRINDNADYFELTLNKIAQ